MANEGKEGKSEEKKEADPDAQVQEEKAEPKKEEAESADSVKDRLLRLAAEFDNYKKRVAKEIEASKNIGKAEAVAKILPNIDEFELAIAAMGKGNDEKGILLVYSNLVSTLKGLGLKAIETNGVFDPNVHEIMLVQASEKKEGTILEVVRKGYTLNGIMLRPASVIVSGGNTREEKKDEKQETK